MITQENILFLQRCFDVGRLGVATSPNPSVGCVIVAADGRIIGEGCTRSYGGSHAEVVAVASVRLADRPLLPMSTIFVSLEPCAHFGRTPPCVDLIIREKIPKVVIAFLDPNPLVCGKSVTKLQENNVEVKLFRYNNHLFKLVANNVLSAQEICIDSGKNNTLMPFFTNVTKNRPFIILKWAQSADGCIGKHGEQVKISNNISKKLVHKWRSEVDAIMVGTSTAAADDPELTNRLYFGKSPIRVVLDRNLRLSPSLRLFDGTVETLVYSEKTDVKIPKYGKNTEGGQKLENSNLEAPHTASDVSNVSDVSDAFTSMTNVSVRTIPFDDLLFEHILADLQANKVGILFVEGGEKLLSSFIERGLWDEARIFTSAKAIGEGIRAPQLLGAHLEQTVQLDDDTLRMYRRED